MGYSLKLISVIENNPDQVLTVMVFYFVQMLFYVYSLLYLSLFIVLFFSYTSYEDPTFIVLNYRHHKSTENTKQKSCSPTKTPASD